MDYILSPCVQLFRYDIVEPPKEFSKEFKNPSYTNYGSDLGPKNTAGLFFFYNGKSTAIQVGKNNLKKGDYIEQHKIWITTVNPICDLKLLDIRSVETVTQLYVTLLNNDIDIFRSDFYKIQACFPSVPMSQIRNQVIELFELSKKQGNCLNKDIQRKRDLSCEIENFFETLTDPEKVKYACQQLTDFDNGILFRDMLIKKGYQGMIFNESDKSVGSDTICLLDISNFKKLSCEELFL